MKVILSHTNLDFGGLASMIGANKLFPQSIMILPEKVDPSVDSFLTIYKDNFPFKGSNTFEWSNVTDLILVNTNNFSGVDVNLRVSRTPNIVVYDHHPKTDKSLLFSSGEIGNVGATITIIAEQLQASSIEITPFEATVFAIGLYSDTGSFTSEQTTRRDLLAGAWFLENGANITLIQQFIDIPLSAKDIMSSPVRVVTPEMSIKDVSKMFNRYGHTGFPIVEKENVVGSISRKDIDKALHHGLGYIPVKSFMSHYPITINKYTNLGQIQEYMIDKNIGRLPVVEEGVLVGIVSRTDVIEAIHSVKGKQFQIGDLKSKRLQNYNLNRELEEQLSDKVYSLLMLIRKESSNLGIKAYLVGGMVRDLFLKRSNQDMDVVVEGDGLKLAKHLQEKYGGQLRYHEKFGTAAWRHPSNIKVDLISARTEFYNYPGALPEVEKSTIKEDLFRRDFTFNAMAISLDKEQFGTLLDFFHGYEDLLEGKLKILHNLSFVEDPTRILRAIRFESRLGFAMDSQTEGLAKQSANNLLTVSKSRIANELKRLFIEEDPVYGVKRMAELGVLPFLLNTLESRNIINIRIKRLSRYIITLKKEGITLDSVWISFLLLLTPLKREKDKLWLYSLNKGDQMLLEDLYELVKDNPLEKKYPDLLGDWHQHFSGISIETMLVFITLLPEETSLKGLKYILSREKMQKKVTGADLKQFGLQPSPKFKELLLNAEALQLNNPELSKEKILEKIIQ
ncbi:tRNA nucleotidyltransferase/poly(A) polymerase/CBS domain-containing protein [Evansella vedderi]|uniref:tRNA nucleotidyltransferase/poly(A) polymerase/CBS domain-containing protein n=1 Tax=Evansella vedderi TaxID=38282 RepID=A0ABT9ZUE0_9BACI|nr:CBS domain-containing protein [Evansella vedderi]MDQ0254306.1 tRNA nucleotidyltransferase/poly(A) polymerase/CBS domain-containing protein [Evansella vedderi]